MTKGLSKHLKYDTYDDGNDYVVVELLLLLLLLLLLMLLLMIMMLIMRTAIFISSRKVYLWKNRSVKITTGWFCFNVNCFLIACNPQAYQHYSCNVHRAPNGVVTLPITVQAENFHKRWRSYGLFLVSFMSDINHSYVIILLYTT